MIWLYILILYFLGAIIVGLIVYTLCVKQYLKERSDLDFNDWIEEYEVIIIFTATFWFMALPVWIIVCSIKAIAKKINKHYNID